MNTNITPSLINQVISEIEFKINDLREQAGYAGEMGDRGSSLLASELNAWKAGLNHEWPSSWEEYVVSAAQKLDPDYAEYQRLKKKFEGD
jgi:hypothetical protein